MNANPRDPWVCASTLNRLAPDQKIQLTISIKSVNENVSIRYWIWSLAFDIRFRKSSVVWLIVPSKKRWFDIAGARQRRPSVFCLSGVSVLKRRQMSGLAWPPCRQCSEHQHNPRLCERIHFSINYRSLTWAADPRLPSHSTTTPPLPTVINWKYRNSVCNYVAATLIENLNLN